MRTLPVLFRVFAVSILAGWTMLPAAIGVLAQEDAQQKNITVKLSEADKTSAKRADAGFLKAWRGNKPGAPVSSQLVARGSAARGVRALNALSTSDDLQIRFPADLDFHGGKVVEFAESHPIYLLPNGKCPIAKCWGDPARFLRDIGKSDFIHVVDQYVGEVASNRYRLGDSASISYSPPADPLTDDDMLAVVHAVASLSGETGSRHIYHVFLAPGQDECIDSTFTICASNAFCAYHSSATFEDIGHILYTVEPYENVIGCQVRPGTPNGTLIDSTDSVLSHELIETITDPNGTGWWNSSNLVLFGEEIADECIFVVPPAFSDPSIIIANGHKYAIQSEYSNHDHGCIAEKQ